MKKLIITILVSVLCIHLSLMPAAANVKIINNTDDIITISHKSITHKIQIPAHSQKEFPSESHILKVMITSPNNITQDVLSPIGLWWWKVEVTKNTDPHTQAKNPYLFKKSRY